MNDQERQVISDIFRRLEQVANQPRDPEAERFIAEKLRQQPYAPYALAQTVFVQEQALANLQAENRAAARRARSGQPPAAAGWLPVQHLRRRPSRPPGPAYNTPPARQASPWGSPQPHQQPALRRSAGRHDGRRARSWGGGMMQRGGGGGFLRDRSLDGGGRRRRHDDRQRPDQCLRRRQGSGRAMKRPLADTGGADQGADADNAGITDSLYQTKPAG